jgi:predicted transcriptional regulator
MGNKVKVTFLSADHLEQRAALRVRQAEELPPGEARQHALKNAAQLRTYADMKRLLTPDRTSLGAKAKG